MIQLKYKELLTVDIEHSFYQNKYCAKYKTVPVPDFGIVPTPDTISLMKRLGMVFRANPEKNGFTVFVEIKEALNVDDYLLRVTPPDGSKLTFYLQLKNNNFLNFSDLDLKNGQILYVNNRVVDAGASRNDLHLMTDNDQVKTNKDLAKSQGSDYVYEHNAMVAMGTVKVRFLDTNQLIDPTFIQKSPTGSTLIFDLQSLSTGRCQLEINGVVFDSFYHTGNLDNVFGIIELYFDNLMPNNYRMLEDNLLKFNVLKKDRPLYKIKFANRKTLWKYVVDIQKSGLLSRDLNLLPNPAARDNYVNKLNLIANDVGLIFTKTSGTGEDSRLSFTSNNPIDLKEKFFVNGGTNDLTMKLRKLIGDPSEGDLKTQLPLPNTTISPVKDPILNTITVYSEVVVLI
jgi:hypothetical protein